MCIISTRCLSMKHLPTLMMQQVAVSIKIPIILLNHVFHSFLPQCQPSLLEIDSYKGNEVDFEKMLKDSQTERQGENWDTVKGQSSKQIGTENKTGNHCRSHIEDPGLKSVLGKLNLAVVSLSSLIWKRGKNKLPLWTY